MLPYQSEPHYFGIFLCIIGIVIIIFSVSNWKNRNKLLNLSSIPISSAPQGLVRFSGFAWAQSYLLNLEDHPSSLLYWQLSQEEENDGRTESHTIASGYFPDGFILKDETGAAWIHVEKSSFHTNVKSYDWKQLSDKQKNRFLSWVGKNYSGKIYFNAQYKLYIRELKLGSPVLVYGNYLSDKKTSEKVLKGINAFTEKYVKIQKSPSAAMQIMDTDNNGNIDAEEYNQGHTNLAESITRTYAHSANVSIEDEEIEIRGTVKSTNENQLTIADTHQKFYSERTLRSFYKAMGVGCLLLFIGICIVTELF